MGERLQSTNSTMVMAGTSGIAAVVSLPTTTVAPISASATARASARGASVSGVRGAREVNPHGVVREEKAERERFSGL